MTFFLPTCLKVEEKQKKNVDEHVGYLLFGTCNSEIFEDFNYIDIIFK